MAAVYSTALWHQLLPTNPVAPAPLYIVPAGQILVVRQIDHWTGSGIPSRADYGEAQANLFWTAVELTGTDHLSGQWQGRQVFYRGMVVTGQANADFVWSRGSGYLLTAP